MGYRFGGTRGLVIGWGIFILKNAPEGTSLIVQWLELYLPIHGVRVQSLVGDSHMSHGQKIKTKNMKHCNTFNKDFLK